MYITVNAVQLCYNFYTSISCEPDTQLSTCLSPCDTIPCPVLAAGEMTHQRKHTIGDTTIIPNNSIHTLWSHKPNTGSNIPVATDYRDGEDLSGSEGNYLDHSWTNNKHVYFPNYCLQNYQKLQEIIVK